MEGNRVYPGELLFTLKMVSGLAWIGSMEGITPSFAKRNRSMGESLLNIQFERL
jgi:hypothetical protein